MPQLVRLYIVNVAIGFALALVFTGLLIAVDVAHLRHLVLGSGGAGVIALVMLVVFNTLLFAGVQFAIAVMRMADRKAPPAGGRRERVRPAGAVTVPVPARARR
ncbi:hypothetical protein [uncultured Paracoccus sp.]|uniref:hypothetical protein n=1 Tax=uncultured Paracoccus sp. TaxID=189685 RepID=UPI002615AB21|nr:hypothetical protein [uncultured Paracoccus sp.]